MELRRRKAIRLAGYDYSRPGYYFITICVQDRHEILGSIIGAGSARPRCEFSEYGNIVERNIIELPRKYKNIVMDNYVIMPNHIHLLIINRGRVVFPARRKNKPLPLHLVTS